MMPEPLRSLCGHMGRCIISDLASLTQTCSNGNTLFIGCGNPINRGPTWSRHLYDHSPYMGSIRSFQNCPLFIMMMPYLLMAIDIHA